MKPVEDEELLAALNSGRTEVTDPELLKSLGSESPELKPEERQGLVDKLRGGLQSFNEGTLAGFGDEAVGFWRTALDYAMPETEADRIAAEFGGEEQSMTDRYKMYRDDERDVQAQFAEENPGSALALSLAGGVASPLNAVAPGSGMARVAGAAAGQGGLAGLGTSEGESLGEIASDVAGGAAIGGALGLGIGGLGRTLSKRRIGQDMVDAQGNFTPIHMTDDDNLLTEIYREGVGRTYGGDIPLQQQQQRIFGAAQDSLAGATDDLAATTARAKGSLKQAMQTADRAAAREAMEAAMPSTMPQKVKDAARNAKTATEAEEIISEWWSSDAFQSIKGYSEIKLPNNLWASIKSTMSKNPEFKEALTPAIRKQLKAAVEKGEVNGKEFMELRNAFARAANKAPSMKGKGSAALRSKFDNILKGIVEPEDWATYQAELGSWGGKQTLSKSAKQARRGARDITAKDVVSKATDASDLQKSAAIQEKARKAAEKAGTKEGLNLRDDIVSGKQVLDEAKAGLKHTRSKMAKDGAPLSKLFMTAAFGAGAPPVGYGVTKTLAKPGVQKAVAGQTGFQAKLRELIEQGYDAQTAQNIARMWAQQSGDQ